MFGCVPASISALRFQRLLLCRQIGFTAGGALLGAMLLRGLPWQSLFWVTSAGGPLGHEALHQ